MPTVTRNLWRISNHKSLSGAGGLKFAARWHSAGRPIVYLAESPAGAMLEVLVHLELEEGEMPRSYTLLRIEVPVNLAIDEIPVPTGSAWKSDHAVSRQIGDRWLAGGTAAIARIPSAILPMTSNYILNPLHPDANLIRIAETAQAEFDVRLLRHLR